MLLPSAIFKGLAHTRYTIDKSIPIIFKSNYSISWLKALINNDIYDDSKSPRKNVNRQSHTPSN